MKVKIIHDFTREMIYVDLPETENSTLKRIVKELIEEDDTLILSGWHWDNAFSIDVHPACIADPTGLYPFIEKLKENI